MNPPGGVAGPLAERDAGAAVWTPAAPAAPRAAADAGPARATLESVTIDGESYAMIHDVDAMPPFLMNLATDTDLWMFINSAGGLTAGRRDPDGAIFPYETVDELEDAPHRSGPITLVRWGRDGVSGLWEPWSPVDRPEREVRRALAKNTLGNRLWFEEVDPEAQLAFRYRWAGSDETGWVRTARLTNLGERRVAVRLLDGLRNLLPSGVALGLLQQAGCLVDTYKRADLDPETGLGIYSLTARVSDRPEPAEELRATTVWSAGLPGARVALSARAIGEFRRDLPPRAERVRTGGRGHYLVTATARLEPGEQIEWLLAADTRRSHVQIARLRERLRRPAEIAGWTHDALDRASAHLRRIVGSADGFQLSGRARSDAHHVACVLFNVLRGGAFVDGGRVPRADFVAFVIARDRRLAARSAAWLERLPEHPTVTELHAAARASGDAGLRRLCLEYLPLFFGRRHGDPSRPWNRFSIQVRNPDGTRALRYEGNWRDVFQNWEALTLSCPAFLPGVVAKFVNASTLDGFNPYRIGRDGVDWEVPDPHAPWSGIGYWGDHQIVYLLRLLESLRDRFPGALAELLPAQIFSYADVPYRLAPYHEMLAHPRSTITFDEARAAQVAERVAERGSDGRLVAAHDGGTLHVSLLEKLLVPALAKLSCFVPEGGIWMNTERPEWNDANNALAGPGLSVVTLCHLRRYLSFLGEQIADDRTAEANVSAEVVEWLRRVSATLARHAPVSGARIDDRTRRRVMDELGAAFTEYRAQVEAHGLSAGIPLGATELADWCRIALTQVDHSIRANRGADGLVAAYNLLETGAGTAAVRPLGPMLEGVTAALGSGLFEGEEAAALLEALFASPLHARERDTFLLYPERELPSFLERNRVPEAAAEHVPLVAMLLAARDPSIVERDAEGAIRFHADFAHARDLAAALDRLGLEPAWAPAVARDRQAMLDLFDEVFQHRTFTGRSGTMYSYEGIGCVYWHMVGKLLLAVQEAFHSARERGDSAEVCSRLERGYFHIRAGLGFERAVDDFGAFPADPYSHTPAHGGAQQPGMTGQVKEQILARFGELGVRVRGGIVEFAPALLRREDFLAAPGAFHFVDPAGVSRSLALDVGTLAFTCCQVPVVYTLTSGAARIRVTMADGSGNLRDGRSLSAEESGTLLGRLGAIARIDVTVPERELAG